MKVIKKELSSDIKVLELIPFSDWHIGDESCNLKEIRGKIDYVNNNPNAYCMLNGDLLNYASATSISDSYTGLRPMEEIELLVKLLKPIKDKILGMGTGNHCWRAYKKEGLDLMKLLANELDIEDIYAPEGFVLFLKFGHEEKRRNENRKVIYSIYVTHGSGGGRKPGSKINTLNELKSIIDTDLYIIGHTHLPAVFKENYYRTSLNSASIQEVEKIFVNTNAMLNYSGYGQMNRYTPASRSNPVIYLNGTKKQIEVKL